MDEINQQAVQAATNPRQMDEFIRRNEPFILRCASGTVHRYVVKSDDEWSVALLAFAQAVQDYSAEKGSFLSFARMVIHRRLIDYLRTECRHSAETCVSPGVLDSSAEGDEANPEVESAVFQQAEQAPGDSLKLEIETANRAFSAYGFSFFDLAGCSPKAEKTKKACARAAACVIRHPILVSEMKASGTLPLKAIEKSSGVPRKILERHRKYIIAAVEIMTGDYPYLADYMRLIREELSR